MSLHALANQMAARGRGPDSTLVHMSPREVQGLQALAMANGGSLTVNPQTGLPEAGFLDNLLPALAGFALNAFAPGIGGALGSTLGLTGAAAETVGTGLLVGGATGLATGSLEKGLMAGLGAYGGAGLEGSLNAAGKAALEQGANVVQAPGEAGRTLAATSPSSTFDRLKAGIGAFSAAPADALKDNALNFGLASAPILAGTFDEQQTSRLKPNPGNILIYKRDPVTGKSYVDQSIPGDQAYRAPSFVWGNANGGLIKHYDDGGVTSSITDDAVKKGIVWGNVPDVDLTGHDLNDKRSDSEKVQDYLMGKGPNPFLFYHKPPTVDPIKKAAEATTEIAKKVEEQQRGGGSGISAEQWAEKNDPKAWANLTDQEKAAYFSESPTMLGIQETALNYWGKSPLGWLQNAIDPSIQERQKNIIESAKTAAALRDALQKAPIQNLTEITRNPFDISTTIPAASPMTQDPAQQQAAAQQAAAPTPAPAVSVSGGEFWGGEGREGRTYGVNSGEGRGGSYGPVSDRTLSEHISQQDRTNDRDARGGFLNHGRFDQRYADGGATGGGSIDLHVPINIGGGGQNYTPMGGGFGSGAGLGGFMQQGGMSRPSPDFLQQQQASLPGYQAVQKAQQDYSNSDEYRNFQKYAQDYQQSLGGRQSGSFGGMLGGSRGGFGQAQSGLMPYGGAPIGKPSYEQYLAGRSPTQQDVQLTREQYENPQQSAFAPGAMMAAGGITALAGGGYNLGSYSDGGRLLRGPGDGVSDDIPATIGQNQPARLADGEFVVPARIVSELGNGSTEAGARKLYAMMDRIQKARTKTIGKDKVATNTRSDKYLPA